MIIKDIINIRVVFVDSVKEINKNHEELKTCTNFFFVPPHFYCEVA